MATLRINKELKFRPVLPTYEEKKSILHWGTETKEDIGALDSKLFDRLVSAILKASTGAKIVTEEVSLSQAAQFETELFIRHGNRPVPPKGRALGETVTIQADRIVITQQMLNDTNCSLSLSSFALMRDTNDSYLTCLDKEQLIIDSNPSSEENSEFERWNCSNNQDMQAIVNRKRYFRGLRNGTIKPPEQEKPIFKQYPNIINGDNSLNRSGRLREWLKRESAFLSSITKR